MGDDVEQTLEDVERRAMLDQIGAQLVSGYSSFLTQKQRRRRRRTVVSICVASIFVLSATGLEAARFLTAPPSVQSDLAGVDQGLPADLRYNPDVANAHSVAETDGAILYGATMPKGGYCTEIATTVSGPRGAICRPPSEVADEPISMTVSPLTAEAGAVIGGKVNVVGATSLRITYSGGSGSHDISLQASGYFIFVIPDDHAADVRVSGFAYEALSSAGASLASGIVPADWNEAARSDTDTPLFVMTRSDSSDFTKVYGIEGHVAAAGATQLVLSLSDGTDLSVPLQADGSFSYDIPSDHVGDFMRPQHLLAEDAKGKVVASAVVTAVAWSRGH